MEILSPSNRPADVSDKVHSFIAAGSRAVWLVDPDARTVTVHDQEQTTVVEGSGTIVADPVLPGLNIALPDIFRNLQQP